MKSKKLSLIAIILLAAACNTGKSDRSTGSAGVPYLIDLESSIGNAQSVLLSTLVDEIEYIPLETDTACMLRRISNLALCDSFIVVSDGSKLILFDRQGNYLKPVGSVGRGPEEYTYVRSFFVDKNSREIYLLSMGKVMVFGFDGRYKRSFKADFRPSQVISRDHNTLMFHLFNLSGPSPDTAWSWYITDRQGAIINRILNHHKRVSQPGLIVPESPLYLYNNAAHFLEFGNDTLYYFNEQVREPYVIFNAGKLKMETDLHLTPETIREVSDRIQGNFWIKDISESDDFLFVNLAWGLSDSVSYCIYDKKNARLTVLKDNGFGDNFNGGPAFWPLFVGDNNTLVDYEDAFTF
ncbi:MAG TPA: hypothetical protein DEO60_02395, partial [Bacteroidales bacterium]|nr:hypothetical protein [Bacteroidales bacterium]